MSNVKNKPKRSKHNAKISIKKGYFGLRVKGNLPQEIRRKAATLGKYWSAYSVEEYFELREQHVNIHQLSGWYYSSDIINLLNINSIKYYLQ